MEARCRLPECPIDKGFSSYHGNPRTYHLGRTAFTGRSIFGSETPSLLSSEEAYYPYPDHSYLITHPEVAREPATFFIACY